MRGVALIIKLINVANVKRERDYYYIHIINICIYVCIWGRGHCTLFYIEIIQRSMCIPMYMYSQLRHVISVLLIHSVDNDRAFGMLNDAYSYSIIRFSCLFSFNPPSLLFILFSSQNPPHAVLLFLYFIYKSFYY